MLAVALASTGCGREADVTPAAKSVVGPVPPATQRPGDPAAGYVALINEAYISCGIPYRAYKRIADPVPPAAKLPGREGRNAGLPYSLNSYTTPSGVELVTSNCLFCHAAYFNGKLVVGLGNETLDFTEDPRVGVERAGIYVRGAAETAEWQKWADRVGAMAPYITADTVGINPAPSATQSLMAHRAPMTLAWSENPLLEPPPQPPLPVSVPPWWRMKKKHAMFYHKSN